MSKKGIIITILVVILALFGGVAAYAVHLLNRINYTDTESMKPENEGETEALTAASVESVSAESIEAEEVVSINGIKNILLIGQDKRPDEDGNARSDTMIICTLHPDTKTITLVSLMRDMYVPIPGYGANRMNAAYAFGGAELLKETVEQDFGINIDGCVAIDFEGFLKGAEQVMPITMELSREEADYITNTPMDTVDQSTQPGGWVFHEGENELYSGAMMEYARMRKVGNSDYERTERQRKLIKAVYEKSKHSSIIKLLKMAEEVFPYITTDMKQTELLNYMRVVFGGGYEFDTTGIRIPADGLYTSTSVYGMSVLVPDIAANAELAQKYIYGEVVNDSYKHVSQPDTSQSAMAETLIPDSEEKTAATPTPTATPEATQEPTAAPTEEPVQEPEITEEPVVEPTETPAEVPVETSTEEIAGENSTEASAGETASAGDEAILQ